MRLSEVVEEPTPKGKRSVRSNIWGNLNGYVAGRFWITFGCTDDGYAWAQADEWLKGES